MAQGKTATELAADSHQVAALTWALYLKYPNLYFVGVPQEFGLSRRTESGNPMQKSKIFQVRMQIDSCKTVAISFLGL